MSESALRKLNGGKGGGQARRREIRCQRVSTLATPSLEFEHIQSSTASPPHEKARCNVESGRVWRASSLQLAPPQALSENDEL